MRPTYLTLSGCAPLRPDCPSFCPSYGAGSAVQRRVPLPVGDDVAVTAPLVMLELRVAGDQLVAEARARHSASLEGADRVEQVERQALEVRVVVAVRVHVAFEPGTRI